MKHPNLQIIWDNGQPYGIRDADGYLLFFPNISKYTDQEQRYLDELDEMCKLASIIFNRLKNRKP